MLLAAVIGYLLLTVLLGLWAARRVRNAGDYVNAGRRLPLFLSSAALFALWFGSETLFGATGAFLEGGLLGVVQDPLGGVLCLLLFGSLFARRLYRMNLLTLGDLFRNQYGKQVELLSAAFMLLTFFGYIAAQLVALGLLLQLLTGLSLSTGILLSAGIVTLYTLAGGMWAISVTDFAQGLLILLGLGVATVLVVQEAGGLPTVLQNVPEQQFRLLPEAEPRARLHYLAAWMTLGLGSLSSQDLFQRMNSSKSEAVAVQSFYLGAFLYLLIAAIPLLLVLAAQQIYPQLLEGDMQQVLIRIIQHSMPLWVQILFFGALLSAILSTCSGAILAPASILSENLLRPLLRHRLNDRQFLLLLRSSVVVMAAAGTSMALWRNNIFELVAESSILGLVTLLVPMTAAVFFPERSPARAAIASMFGGIVVWWSCQYLLETEYPAMMYGLAASILAQWAFRGPASRAVEHPLPSQNAPPV